MAESPKKFYIIKPRTVFYNEKHVYTSFLKSDSSIFIDKYDLKGERLLLRNLADLNQNEIDMTHENYVQWLEFKKHEEVLKTYIFKYKQQGPGRKYKSVANVDLNKIDIFTSEDEMFKQVGALKNEAPDIMVLHTPHAFRLWKGLNDKNRTDKHRMTGVIGAIANAKVVSLIADGHNNPYADVVLLKLEYKINKVDKELERVIKEYEALLSQKEEYGIILSPMVSSEPMTIELNFGNPYGHLFAQLTGKFDKYVRIANTLKNKTIISTQENSKSLNDITYKMRSLNEYTHDQLNRLELIKSFNRDLILTRTPEEMSETYKKLAEHYGPIPEDVLLKKYRPKYLNFKTPYKETDCEYIRKSEASKMSSSEFKFGANSKNHPDLMHYGSKKFRLPLLSMDEYAIGYESTFEKMNDLYQQLKRTVELSKEFLNDARTYPLVAELSCKKRLIGANPFISTKEYKNQIVWRKKGSALVFLEWDDLFNLMKEMNLCHDEMLCHARINVIRIQINKKISMLDKEFQQHALVATELYKMNDLLKCTPDWLQIK